MQILRLTNSSSAPRYLIKADTPNEAERLKQLTADDLADYVQDFNYGARIDLRTSESVHLTVYID